MIEINEADVLGKPKRATDYSRRGENVSVVWLATGPKTMLLEEGVEFLFRGRSYTVRRREIMLTIGGKVIRLYYK